MAKVKKSTSLRLGSGIILNFNLSQHSRDYELMNSFIKYLDCGRIQKRKDKEAVAFEVNRFEDINTKIIPFFLPPQTGSLLYIIYVILYI